MIRLPGVRSITGKIVQEEGRVLEPVLRKGASVTMLLRLSSVLNTTSGNYMEVEEGLCWERGPL